MRKIELIQVFLLYQKKEKEKEKEKKRKEWEQKFWMFIMFYEFSTQFPSIIPKASTLCAKVQVLQSVQ
jgi:hypothetical protein